MAVSNVTLQNLDKIFMFMKEPNKMKLLEIDPEDFLICLYLSANDIF
jgi:hypothetical protein